MIKFRDNLYIGNLRDLADDLQGYGITAVVTVAYEIDIQPIFPEVIRYVKISLSDDNKNKTYMKHLAINTVIDMREEGEIVLVHCSAGLSRSPYVATMAVSWMEDREPSEVWDELFKLHPFILKGGLWEGQESRIAQQLAKEEKIISVNGGTCVKCGEEKVDIVGSNIHECKIDEPETSKTENKS